MLQATERRKVLPAPNLSNCQKREGHCPEHVPECRREQENNSLRPQNTNALHNLPVTTATHPTTHSANKKHHQYKTPPASTVTPRLSEKSASQSAIGLLGHSGRGRTNRRGTFRTGSPFSGTGNVCQHPKISGNRYCNRMGRRNVGFDEENQRSFGLLPSNFVSLQNGIEVWCNGSTTDFGSACPSSNLGTSTFLREVRHY